VDGKAWSHQERAGVNMIRVGVVGYGHWGPNLVRSFGSIAETTVVAVSDTDTSRLALARGQHPTLSLVTPNAMELIRSPEVDAVVVATNVSTHFELSLAALTAGKHTLVGKPMTTSVAQADRLIEKAAAAKLALMVDHTCVYSGGVRLVHDLFADRHLGRLVSYDSVRANLGAFQRDVNVLWDLAVHDLSIMDFVIDESPVEVSATGGAPLSGRSESSAYLTCFFESSAIAHCRVSWLAPTKARQTIIVGSKQMLVYDELVKDKQVVVHDAGAIAGFGSNATSPPVQVWRRGAESHVVDSTEPLRLEAIEFARAIGQGRAPLTDGLAARRVIGVLEAADESLRNRGRPVVVNPH